MTDKFRNKYRIPSARWQSWDYSADGLYFITICAANREPLFGEIRDGEMYLSETGLIVCAEWEKSFGIRRELFCDIFQIMPNHIHAILRIAHPVQTHGCASLDLNPEYNLDNEDLSGDKFSNDDNQTHGLDYKTHGRASLQRGNGVAYRSPQSVSSFLAGFKSAATSCINHLRQTPRLPVWQTRFHDHVIRDHQEYGRIYHYIETNVANWHQDCFFMK